MGKLLVNIVKATFSGKPVRKIKVHVTGGGTTVRTKEVAPGNKDKTSTPTFNEEHAITNFDPTSPFEIELFTSKGSQGQLKMEKGIASIHKFNQGEQWAKTFDFGTAKVDIVFTAVDFGTAPKAAKPTKSSGTTTIKAPPISVSGAPSEDEVNRQFALIAGDMGLTPDKVKNMTKEQKWQMIQLTSAQAPQSEGEEGKASYWIEKMKKPDDKILKKVQFHVGSKGVIWLEEFSKLGGLTEMCKILEGIMSSSSPTEPQKKMKKTIGLSFAKIGNGKAKGAELLAKTKGAIDLTMLLWNDADLENKDKADILKFLSFMCTIPGGHRIVTDAANHYKKVKKEKARFETLVQTFNSTTVAVFLQALMGFFNALISNPKDLDLRNRIRRELNFLGFKTGLEKLRKFQAPNEVKIEEEIDKEINSYDKLNEQDDKQLKTRFDHVGDTSTIVFNVDWLFSKIKDSLNKESIVKEAVAREIKDSKKSSKKSATEYVERSVKPDPIIAHYLNDVLVDLVGIDLDSPEGVAQWAVAARIIHQLSLLASVDESDKDLSAYQRIPLEQFLATVQLTEKQDTFPLTAEIDKLKQDMADMAAKCKEIDGHLEKNQKTLKAKKDACSSKQDDVNHLSNQKNRSANELNSLKDEYERIRAEQQALEDEAKLHEQELQHHDSQILTFKSQTDEYERAKSRLISERTQLKKDVEVHTRLVETGQFRADPIKKQADLMTLEIEDLKKTIETKTKAVEQAGKCPVKQLLDDLYKKTNELRTKAATAALEMDSLPERETPEAEAVAVKQKKLDELKPDVEAAKEKVAPLKQKQEELAAQVKKLEEEIKTAKASAGSGGGSGAATVGAGEAMVRGGPPPPGGAMARGGPPAPGSGGPPPPPGSGGPPPPPGGGMARGGPPPPPGSGGPPPPPGAGGMARGGPPPPPGAGGPPPPPGARGPPPPPGGRGGPPPPPGGRGGPPPPPGGRGGPPGPPGMPGRGRGGPPPGPAVPEGPKPKGKVKPLNWKKLPANKAQESIFSKFDLAELKGFKLDFDAIESKFAVVTAAPKENEPKKVEKTVMVFLDPKVAQNLNIWLSKYKRTMTNADITKAVQNLDKKTFDQQAVTSLISFIPTADEVSQMTEYLADGGDLALMGTAEQFSIEYSKVGQLADRLKCFQTLVDFEPKKVDLMPDIATLEKCSDFISKDKKIERFCEIILHIGNFLNSGNKRLGEALGFKFETIGKLGDTKASDNKRTMLDVVIQMVMDNPEHSGLLKFTKEEVDLLSAGARLSLQTFQAELSSLTKQFEAASKLAPNITPIDSSDKFQEVYTVFAEKAAEDLASMNKDFESALKKFKGVVSLLGEDPEKMQPDEFFSVWQGFVQKIVETSEKIIVEREKAEKLAKREQAKAATSAAKPSSPKPAENALAAAAAEAVAARGRGRGRGRGA